MNEIELLAILARGEDIRRQFKENFSNVDSLAAELVAFANSGGGTLIVGANDAGEAVGLTAADIGRLNPLLSNAASQSVRPPIHPLSFNIQTARGLLMVIQAPDGLNRPYTDNQGRIWVKSGADKRHVTAREEMQWLFQQAGLIYADEVPVAQTTVADIDHRALEEYFENRYREPLADTDQSLERLLRNMGLVRDGALTLAGLLLFGKKPERFRP
jgi:ATP-dependent DNA helicase RecG